MTRPSLITGAMASHSRQFGYTSSLGLLILVLFLAASATFLYLKKLNFDFIAFLKEESAGQYIGLLTEFRTLYTSEVVATAAKAGLEISHDYHNKEKAIPLPATLSMLLIEKLDSKGAEVSANLYSPYPFPWRAQVRRPMDDFALRAWRALNKEPNLPFIEVQDLDGQISLRYAVADIMRPQCINCHNTHPNTPKRDWKVGDVRGVLEVIEPLNSGVSKAKGVFLKMASMISGLVILSAFGAVLVVRQLQRQHKNVSALNDKLTREVKERQEANKALEQAREHEEHAKEEALIAKEEAVAANKAKSQFLANISHEIRTPMNAILGYNQILQRSTGLTKDQANSLSIVARSGEHLLGLINDVLDLSKIEANVIETVEDEFDLQEMCTTLSDMFELKAKQKNLSWQTVNQFALPSLMVKGDSGKLRQVLINLIGNAIKFTESGFVRFNVIPQKQTNLFRFEVIDSGPGIESKYHKTIFDAFNQGDKSSMFGGTGLGLSISQRYLNLMGSELHLESSVGNGSTFYFELTLEVLESETVAKPMRLVSHLKPNQDKTILVIDDIEINRHLLCRMLDDIGFHTVNTGSAKHALTMLKDNEVDLIFTDMMMPDMSGDEFLAVFRKFDQNTPVVAFSASSLQVNVDYYTAKGFDSYLSKPFRFEDVYQLIKELIHVEYQYRSELMEEEQAPDLASWKRLCLDNQDKIAALIAFCALYQITEIENLLDEWLSSVPESESFVNTLRSYVGKYDLEGLEAFLTGLKND